MAELVTVPGLLRMLETVDREILNEGSIPSLAPNLKQMEELDKKFQELGWRDTTEAYYGLDFTPFMSVIIEHISEISKKEEL